MTYPTTHKEACEAGAAYYATPDTHDHREYAGDILHMLPRAQELNTLFLYEISLVLTSATAKLVERGYSKADVNVFGGGRSSPHVSIYPHGMAKSNSVYLKSDATIGDLLAAVDNLPDMTEATIWATLGCAPDGTVALEAAQ